MQNLSLIIFVLIRILSNPLANVFQKKLSDSYSSFVINFYTYFLLSIFCICRINILNEFNFTTNFIILIALCGFLCTLGMVCMIKAINIGELSVLGPINSYKSIISLILAFFMLKEIPTIQGITGIILIILGSKYIFDSPQERNIFNIIKRKDIQLRFLALTLTAIEAVLLKKIILMSSVEICFMFWCFMGFFWSIILLILFRKNPSISSVKTIFYILIIAACLGLMQYSTNFVFEKMNVGLSLAVFQLSSIVTVLFGYKIFHEKNILYKLLGSTIMIIGSCLIILDY